MAKGGEGTEYYTYLRQCVKPAAPATGKTCAAFYNWEGSDESGYQLKAETLQASPTANGPEPDLSENDAALCNETIYNYAPSDPAYNPDCRQYYNQSGAIFYHLYSHTIACTEDCHPYKRTEVNVDNDIAQGACNSGTLCSASAADGAGKCWDDISKQCVVCRGGGTWSSQNNSCVYQVVPNQGKTCSAGEKGCREYIGNTGNDVRDIFTDDFEADATTGGWQADGGSTVSRTNVAILLQNNVGHSMLVSAAANAAAKRTVGTAVTEGKSYVLSFLARAESGTADLNISLATSSLSGFKAEFTQVNNVDASWQVYKTNLTNLGHAVTADEFLLITGSKSFYIDNISLTEIVDRYYLIKDSWKTPESCDQDLDHNSSLHDMLGCAQYQDRENQTHNLKQFSKLCSESAVGCELMIDTKNSKSPAASYYEDGQSTTFCNKLISKDCVKIEADSQIYAVYDPDKLCGAEEKGCEFLGKPYTYDGEVLYSGVHLKNDPDKYNGQILCGANAVGCETYGYDQGEQYFKNPGDQVCEYRTSSNQGSAQYWYKKKVKRCGGNSGAVCLADDDCIKGTQCLLETADTACQTSNLKTLGLGGSGNQVSQPREEKSVNWAGICPASDSGCTEYIDPVSKFNTNILFNGDFQTIAISETDGWVTGPSGLCPADQYCQGVTLDAKTTYRLARLNKGVILKISGCPNALYEIKNDSVLPAQVLAGPTDHIELLAGDADSKVFYYQGADSASCQISVNSSAGPVELKKVAIDYQLNGSLDKKSCNGKVDFTNGCVLFNERQQDGSALAELSWIADDTADGASPKSGTSTADSNIIIKVAPDRVCDKWLACKSYIKDAKGNNVCFDIGLCDAVDQNGACQSFLNSKQTEQTPSSLSGKISNLSGYAKVGLAGGSLSSDYYPLAAMVQLGDVAELSNGGFEFYGSNLYPIGWTWGNQANKPWDANVFSVINNPIAAQTEGIGYAPEGASFLKLGSSYDAVSESIDVMPKKDYIITAYINTKNLKSGTSTIDILNNKDAVIASQVIKQDLGNGWNFRVGKFSTGDYTQIKIRLYSLAGGTAGSEGNFYYDDIKIKPALNSKGNWYTPQTCRLYPQSDSLSCDYYADSGARMKGWPGYCLEYDRRPGDPNTCLLWYPIDKVKGDGIEEGAGYLGRAPLYYCAEAVSFVPVERRKKYNQSNIVNTGDCGCVGDPVCPLGYSGRKFDDCGDCGGGGDENGMWTCTASGTIYKDEGDYAWYAYNGSILPVTDVIEHVGGQEYNLKLPIPKEEGVLFYDPVTGLFYDNYIGYCNKLVQVVTPTGQNKYWSGRVYEGSDYKDPNLEYGYNAGYKPFGGVVQPSPSSNPYEWDSETSNSDFRIQPLYVRSWPKTNDYASAVNAGSPYNFIFPSGAFVGLCSTSRMVCIKSTIAASASNTISSFVCPIGETCEDFPVQNNVNLATSSLARLFAKSYGTWDWGVAGTTKTFCENDPSKPCDLSQNDCPGGSCDTSIKDACSGNNNIECKSCPAGITCADSGAGYYSCGGVVQFSERCCNSSNINEGSCVSVNTAGLCVGGTSANQYCTAHQCIGSKCIFQTTVIASDHYNKAAVPLDWGPPTTVCPGTPPTRPVYQPGFNYDYCAIPPAVFNIKVDSATSSVNLVKNGFVNLTFNAKVDSNQLPMVMYGVDWGDNSDTIVSGVKMRDKSNPSNPESIYHLYGYWDLRSKFNRGITSIFCYDSCESKFLGSGDVACCAIKPQIQIRDNWGWCSGGSLINDCTQWKGFGEDTADPNDGWVVVKEK